MNKFVICLSLLLLVGKCAQYSIDRNLNYEVSKSKINKHLIEIIKEIAVF